MFTSHFRTECTPSSSKLLLTSLSVEILQEIFKHLDYIYEAVPFALTCKTLWTILKTYPEIFPIKFISECTALHNLGRLFDDTRFPTWFEGTQYFPIEGLPDRLKDWMAPRVLFDSVKYLRPVFVD